MNGEQVSTKKKIRRAGTAGKQRRKSPRESADKLCLFVDHAPAAVAMFDRKMRYLAVSRRWLEDYELRDGVIGQNHFDIFPADKKRWKKMRRSCLRYGIVEKNDEERIERGGIVQWLKWEARPWFDAGGEIGGIIIFGEDITERKLAQQAIIEKNQLLEQTYDAIFIWNLDDGIVEWNQNAAQLYGFSEKEALGQEVHLLLQTDYPGGKKHFTAELAQKGFWEGELVHTTKSGAKVIVESRQHIINRDGNNIVVLETSRDVTERRQIEKKLARAAQLSLVGEIAAGLAHEIKNPLAGIKGVIDVLLGGKTENSDEKREILESVRFEIERINQTVHAFLKHARPRPLDIKPASLNETIIRAVRFSSHQPDAGSLRSEKIETLLQLPPQPVFVPHDTARMEDVILNLVLNARDAVNEKKRGKIIVRLSQNNSEKCADKEILIEVCDNGCGISEEKLKTIFTPFQTSKSGGTGLGLTSVRRIIRAHGGECEIRSAVGKGTTVILRMPARENQFVQ